MRKPRLALGVVLTAAAVVAAVVGGTSQASTKKAAADEIVIGASIPLTGPLGVFGPGIQAGYGMIVDRVNKAGGISVGGKKMTLKLMLLDNKSDPNLAATQARTLILQNHAVALLGAATPPLQIPLSNVADQLHKPLIIALCPVRAWLAGRPSGWKYAWDAFFDELQMTQLQFQASNLVKTNKKVALFTDTEPDGIVMGGLWEKQAPKFGYKIVSHAKFPVGTTDFSSYIDEAKKAGAEVLIAQMIPPDAIALWKEMKAQGWQPKTAWCEKCANSSGWVDALGPLAKGTSTAGWWDPSLGLPDSQKFVDKFGKDVGINSDLANIVFHYSGAMVIFDAIEKAGTLDEEKIREAMAATDKTYPAGHIKFGANNAGAVDAIGVQWTEGKTQAIVYPQDKAPNPIAAPVSGLAP